MLSSQLIRQQYLDKSNHFCLTDNNLVFFAYLTYKANQNLFKGDRYFSLLAQNDSKHCCTLQNQQWLYSNCMALLGTLVLWHNPKMCI